MNNFLIMRGIIDFRTPYFNARPAGAEFAAGLRSRSALQFKQGTTRTRNLVIRTLWRGPGAAIDHVAAVLAAERKSQDA